MGGSGSGNWYRWNTKSKTESQHRIDIRWLKKQNYLLPGYSGSLSWSNRGENTGWIKFRVEGSKMVLNYRIRFRGEEWEDIEQEVYFDQTSCHYGGYRKWFLCTRCRKRVAVIYGSGKYFLCRHCYNLTYDSCNTSPLQRVFDKADKLKEKLGGKPGFANPVPYRPKGMHRKTYNRITTNIYRLEGIGEDGMMEKWGWCF
jgi:hypothetical protein